ncbi:unnamed protein product [Cylindrotheca closterium]|uniref:Uncharacterized protein n=1 Tax=Cylindrotheca closterium TaxID=2856 RepID=A0AAD2FGL9_9STRA|nr:unnamed protein product [Cylindrotheca closterium]
MSTGSPKRGWSPHSAALKRRQRKSSADASKILGALGNLDIASDDEDIDLFKMAMEKDKDKPLRKGRRKGSSPAKKRSMSPRNKLLENKKLAEKNGGQVPLQEDIPPAIAEKLAIISDPETDIKERIKLEVEMRKNPEEEEYLAIFRTKFDRKKFLSVKEQKDKEEQEQLQKNLKEEELRKKQEEEEFARARQAELDAQREKEEREERMKEEVRLHRAKVLVQDSEEVRKNAEKMLVGVIEKMALNEMEEKERQARIEEFLQKEGADLTHVEKELAKALMEQKSTRTDL